MNIKYVKKPFPILQQGPTHSSSGSCLEPYRKQSSLEKKVWSAAPNRNKRKFSINNLSPRQKSVTLGNNIEIQGIG